MNLTEIFNVCESCVYAPALCGNEPENCVAHIQSVGYVSMPREDAEKSEDAREDG